ncbi:hypothetical protein F511_03174 [Dorcoceras hygrometricum]|uniref:Uncharacterized protein n=1 Tax=Dorcoceras hygrometricum TaxID=472368 RepID=A0A2Z7CT17_9LAMI|nr:hypothetical protein F511_03174 [Dorcoceras hygrometricum]
MELRVRAVQIRTVQNQLKIRLEPRIEQFSLDKSSSELSELEASSRSAQRSRVEQHSSDYKSKEEDQPRNAKQLRQNNEETKQLRAEDRRTKHIRARTGYRMLRSGSNERDDQLRRRRNKIEELKEEERSRTNRMRSEQLRIAQKESRSDNQEHYSSVSDHIGALQQINSHKKRRA